MSRVGAGGDNAAATLAEIEKATPRQVTLRTSSNLSHTAERFGIAPVSLHRLGRWRPRRSRHHAAGATG